MLSLGINKYAYKATLPAIKDPSTSIYIMFRPIISQVSTFKNSSNNFSAISPWHYHMMNFLLAFILLASIASASCPGEKNYRCKNEEGDVDQDYQKTREICQTLGNEWCWCNRYAEWYCALEDTKHVESFKEQCRATGEDWYAHMC